MSYITVRDAVLVHAAAAAAATNPDWLDVAIGVKYPDGRAVRVYFGGETAPVRMGGSRVLNGEMVSHRIIVAAFWPLATLGLDGYKNTEDEAFGFVNQLRTRLLGDSQLGGAAADIGLSYATPDVVVIGSARWLVVELEVTPDYTEYTLAP